MPQSLSVVHIHLVFSTKRRAPFLRDHDLRAEMHAYLVVSSRLACWLVRTISQALSNTSRSAVAALN